MSNNTLLLSRAKSAVLARDFSLAARLYRQLLRNSPDDKELLRQLGDLYMKSGNDDQALGVFKRLSDLDTGDVSTLITMGGIYRRLKRYEESIMILEKALAEDGSNAQISYNLGFTYKAMGNLYDAIGCFEDAIDMNPNDVLAYNHLGVIYAEKNEHEKAIQSYIKGLKLDSNHPILLYNLGKSYEATGEYSKAANSFEAALKSKPLWFDVIDDYARLLIRLNHSITAYNLIKRAMAVDPQNSKLQNALENVEKYLTESSAQKFIEPVREEKPVMNEIPSLFETAVDDSEFDSAGAEISMEDENFSAYEDAAVTEQETETLSASETETGFDFNSMGMDSLANDQVPESLVFEESDELIDSDVPVIENLNNLSDESEIPVDFTDDPDFADQKQNEPSKMDSLFQDENIGDEDSVFEFEEDEKKAEPKIQEAEELDEPEETVPAEEDLAAEEDTTTIEDIQEQLEKTKEMAEKAWEAAQSAADSAQAAEEAMKINMESFQSLEENLPDVQDLEDNIEEFKPYLEMFKMLRSLLEFLPEEKRDAFLSSRKRIQLDYIISKLSGIPGLFASASALIESGAITKEPSPEDEILEGKALEMRVLEDLDTLTQYVADEKLRCALEQLLRSTL